MRKIEADSPQPLRQQLSEILRHEIQDGVLAPGARIPSERALAERYGISRASVREAIAELLHSGILFRTVGRGTFVARPEDRPESARPTVDGVAFLISERVFQFVQTGYNRILAGVESVCRDRGLDLYFHSISERPDAFVSWLERRGPRQVPVGCVLVGAVGRSLLDYLRAQGIAHVLVDLIVSERREDEIVVGIDYARGTGDAVRYLYELGHRSIGYIGFPQSQKYTAYWRTQQALGLPYEPRHVEFLSFLDLQPGVLEGYQAMQRMLEGRNLPTALLVTNDYVALGVVECLRVHNIAIPQQISVVGYDDLGQRSPVSLTTVRADLELVGRLAAQSLLAAAQGYNIDPKDLLVSTQLVPRSSTAPPTLGEGDQSAAHSGQRFVDFPVRVNG